MGIVEEVGPDVKGLAPGDRVVAAFDICCGKCFCACLPHPSLPCFARLLPGQMLCCPGQCARPPGHTAPAPTAPQTARLRSTLPAMAVSRGGTLKADARRGLPAQLAAPANHAVVRCPLASTQPTPAGSKSSCMATTRADSTGTPTSQVASGATALPAHSPLAAGPRRHRRPPTHTHPHMHPIPTLPSLAGGWPGGQAEFVRVPLAEQARRGANGGTVASRPCLPKITPPGGKTYRTYSSCRLIWIKTARCC